MRQHLTRPRAHLPLLPARPPAGAHPEQAPPPTPTCMRTRSRSLQTRSAACRQGQQLEQARGHALRTAGIVMEMRKRLPVVCSLRAPRRTRQTHTSVHIRTQAGRMGLGGQRWLPPRPGAVGGTAGGTQRYFPQITFRKNSDF